MNPGFMNNDLVNSDPHKRARLMIALSGPEHISNRERSWLAAHLESCQSCREFAESTGEAIRSLRGISITASARLISTTQMRVRQRALELQRQQERLWVICACCAAVTLCSAVTAGFLWRGFAWMGQQARFPAPVWEGGFVLIYLTPAVLAGILLLARGTFLADHNRSQQDWSSY
jgi:predicted anti-sigma-YlaC factor YlaD